MAAAATNSTPVEHMANGRCYASTAPLEGPPLFRDGSVVFQAHDVGWIVCAIFTLFACAFSFWLIGKHLANYTNRAEQRYVVRLLFMPPVYAVISTLSFVLWDHSTVLLLVRDCYEGVVLVSFFYLLLTYLSPDPAVQADIFRTDGLSKAQDARLAAEGKPPGHWWFPLNKVRWKPADGMYFLQFIKWTVLQYIVVRPGCTLAAVVLNYLGLYCEESWSPVWGYVWITAVVSVSVSVAMYCLVQLYLCVAPRLAPKQPILKLFSIKAVVFLTFWQASFLAVLASFNAIKDTPYMTANDIEVGWGAILETVEMCAFALLHIKAFSYAPYVVEGASTPRLRSLAHAFDFSETWWEIRDGAVYMWARMRGRETDAAARRNGHHEALFQHSRANDGLPEKMALEDSDECYGSGLPPRDRPYSRPLEIDIHRTVEINREREKRHGYAPVATEYGYGYEKDARAGDGLESAIERELAHRGVPYAERVHIQHQQAPSEGAGRSWWRSIYDRVSTANFDDEPFAPPADYEVAGDNMAPRRARSKRTSTRNFSRPMRDKRAYAEERAGLVQGRGVREYDDAPPPSLIRGYQERERAAQVPLPGPGSGWRAPGVPRIEMSPPPVERALSPPPPGAYLSASPPASALPLPHPSAPYTRQQSRLPPAQQSPPARNSHLLSLHNAPQQRPPMAHADSTSTNGLGFGALFRAHPPSSTGHTNASTPSLAPDAHNGRLPLVRQVNTGRVVSVTLPAPLSPPPALRPDTRPAPPVQPQRPLYTPAPPPSPPRSRGSHRTSLPPPPRPSTGASSPPRPSAPHRQSLPPPTARGGGGWVHPARETGRPIYAAAMQPPPQPHVAGSAESIVSATDDASFVTAHEGGARRTGTEVGQASAGRLAVDGDGIGVGPGPEVERRAGWFW